MKKSLTYFLLMCLLGFISVNISSADLLKLKEGEEGSEVEIIEERSDSFIVRIPKEEIKIIKRKRPTDLTLWKEKRIFWEDTGDYLTIYLPKAKIVMPEDYIGNEYDSAKVLGQELVYTGKEGRPESVAIFKGTGRVVGRILKSGQPFPDAKIKIASVPSQTNTLLSMFSSSEKQSQELVFETTTDELGQFEFMNVPLGIYDLYWSASESGGWYRRLSEKPDITVKSGATVTYPDIKIK